MDLFNLIFNETIQLEFCIFIRNGIKFVVACDVYCCCRLVVMWLLLFLLLLLMSDSLFRVKKFYDKNDDCSCGEKESDFKKIHE